MVQLVFLVLALVLAGAALLASSAAKRKAAAATAWPVAEGRVVASEVANHSINGRYWTPLVSYTFDAGGKAYASDRLLPGGNPHFRERAKAEAVAAKYPAGSTCVVRYDPRRPGVSALEIAPQRWVVVLFGSFAAMCAILALIMTVVTSR